MSATIIIQAIESINQQIPVRLALQQPQLEYVPIDDDMRPLQSGGRD
jgi:alpha-acetolactate decarboxylase